jgi:hypothetical protein
VCGRGPVATVAGVGILDRFRGKKNEPDEPSVDQQREWLAESVTERLDAAFATREEVEESLLEEYVEDGPLSADEVRGALDRAWAERLETEAGWVDEGDYGRLAAAFAELDGRGIVARMNFTCCQTCGHAEIGDERSAAEDERGYVFFHAQDAERLAPGGSELYLAFGGFQFTDLDEDLAERIRAGDEEARAEGIVLSEVAYAGEAVDVLRSHGLTVEWDGTAEQRIQVLDVDWRKRLPA